MSQYYITAHEQTLKTESAIFASLAPDGRYSKLLCYQKTLHSLLYFQNGPSAAVSLLN